MKEQCWDCPEHPSMFYPGTLCIGCPRTTLERWKAQQETRRRRGMCIDCGAAPIYRGGRCQEHYRRAHEAVRRRSRVSHPQVERLHWDRDSVIAALRGHLSGPVSVPEYWDVSRNRTELPSERTVRKYCGTWRKAMEAAFPGRPWPAKTRRPKRPT